MQPPDDPTVQPGQEDSQEARRTDFADDIAEHESGAVSMQFDPRTGQRLKRGAVIFAIVLAVFFIAVWIDRYVKERGVRSAAQQASSAVPSVEVIRAKPVGAVQRFSLPGQTAAWHSSTIYARVNGYVGKWFTDIGDKVQKGEVLALIETPELDAQLTAARAQLKAAEAQVQARTSEMQFAKSTYDRWRDSPKGVVSEQEREEKRADYEGAVARLKSAQADVALDQARVDQYMALAKFKQVAAPFDGVITDRYIDIGNLVTAGSTSATTPLYVMTQNDPMRVFADVPQSASAELMQGHVPVEIQTSGSPGHPYVGKVARTSEAMNTQARTLRVEVDVPNAEQGLVPGMYVNVVFDLQPKGLVQVPAAALIFRSSGPEVARIDPSGRVRFRGVSIARDDGNIVELGSGVAPGDELVLNASSQISEGEIVKASQQEPTGATPASATARR